MCENNSFVISGLLEEITHDNETLGEYIFKRLKKRKAEDIVQVDPVTGDNLTCAQLLENSIKLCLTFKRLNLKRGDIISIISENSINTFPITLASLYMGIAVNPLNPAYLRRELEHALNICKPKMIVCSTTVLESILELKVKLNFIKDVVLIETKFKQQNITTVQDLLAAVVADIDHFVPDHFPIDETAFICLSSGTTSLPKGAIVTHLNTRITANNWLDERYGGFKSNEATVIVLPLFHQFGLLVQVMGIMFTTKLVIMNKFKPEVFLKAIQDYKVKQLFVVPPLLLFLTNTPLLDDYDISHLKDLVCAAAPVGKELHEKSLKRLKHVNVRQVYASTELCGSCTFQKPGTNEPGNVGKLAPNLLAKVWNWETNECVGPLVYGELCFKGPTVMKGYINGKTVTNVFDEDGFYHTGDVGYYDNDGVFYIVDRIKDVIKYKGFQVPPAELEDVILTHSNVHDCGVIGVSDEQAGEVPQAYVVLKKDAQVTEQEIIDYVAERLSIQKRLYGGVRFIENIPRNPSGKILRKELKKQSL